MQKGCSANVRGNVNQRSAPSTSGERTARAVINRPERQERRIIQASSEGVAGYHRNVGIEGVA